MVAGEFLSYIKNMAISIRALQGPLKDKVFHLKEGLKVGRAKGDIVLNDNKVSSLHAFITKEGSQLNLVDNGSKNGIRMNGARVTTVPLLLGVKFEIGDSLFEVFESDQPVEAQPGPVTVSAASISRDSKTQATSPTGQVDLPQEKAKATVEESYTAEIPEEFRAQKESEREPSEGPEDEPHARRWSDLIIEFIDQNMDKIADQPKAIVALNPSVRLTFIGGPQTETVWVLGYGPRRVGPASIDLPIQEKGAPDTCFEILPSPEGVTFRTNHPKEISINGQGRASHSLKTGDIIGIGSTQIEVELLQ